MRIQPKKVLCAIDFSDFTDMVLQYGKSLADEFESKLCLCHVVSAVYMVSSHITPYVDYTGIESERLDQARKSLAEMARKMDIDCDIIVETGSPAEMIAQVAHDQQFDMVVTATYGGSGIKRYLVGSVTDRLVKILSCPLMVLHPTDKNLQGTDNETIKLDRILVGCDFSEDSKLAFDWALSLAQEFQTQLYLAHVIRPEEPVQFSELDYLKLQQGDNIGWNRSEFLNLKAKTSHEIEEKKAKFLARIERQLLNMVPEDSQSWCTPATVVLEGTPYQELIEYGEQKQVDLIVLGVRGHSLLETFIVGSTTDRVISRATCPVLAIRQPKTGKKEGKQVEPANDKKQDGHDIVTDDRQKLTAAQIMETNVITVTPDTKIATAVKLFLDHHINGVPVLDDQGQLKGILCQSDLIFQQKNISMPPVFSMLDSFIPLASSRQLEHEFEKISAITVAQAMADDPVTTGPQTPISEIASLMVENRFHTIPVVEDGKLLGIIGQEDILKRLI